MYQLIPKQTSPAVKVFLNICTVEGDARVNENIGLGMYHTLFIRYHNEVENLLFHLNGHWTGERLYQEARRVVSAVLQHITYNEFLPLVVGPAVIKEFELDIVDSGHYQGSK